MKLATNKNNFKSNMQDVKSQNFGIGDASVVIDILRNRLYKNKIQTLVQEYICNGRDAMREIDSDKNIEIIAPTKFSPTFKVRDYGPGITPDRMATVFVNYGSSTKRVNNKQTGGFGIGAKSAWSYTDSFTIVTYVDGNKRTYVAHTGKNNNGSLDLINTEKTIEPNGTEIQIAVNSVDITEFNNAINRCIFFWTNGYTVKGMDLDNIHTKGEMFNKYLEIGLTGRFLPSISGRYISDLVCTIDDIPYKLTSFLDKIESLKKIKQIVNGDFIIHIPNGLVEVSANREEISDSEYTVKHLTRLLDKTYNELNSSIKAHFKGIDNPYDYVKAFDRYSGKFSLDSYRHFKDYSIARHSNNIESELFKEVKFFRVFYTAKGKFTKLCVNSDDRKSYNRSSYDIHSTQKDRLFFNTDQSPVNVGKRLRKFLENNDNAILIESSGNDKVFKQLIKDLGFKDITTIALPAKVKTAKIKRTAKQICIHSYTRWRKYTHHTTIDDNTDKWYYLEMQGNSLPSSYYDSKIRTLESFFNISICALSKSSVQIVKGNKNFIELNGFLQQYKPTQKQVNSIILRKAKHKPLYNKTKDLSGVKDKNFKALIELYSGLSTNVAEIPSHLPKELLDKIENHSSVLSFGHQDNMVIDFEEDYPLLKNLSDIEIKKNKDDIVMYMNAKYKSKGGK